MSLSHYTITLTKNSDYEFTTKSKVKYRVYFDSKSGGIFPESKLDKLAVFFGFNCEPEFNPGESEYDPKVGSTIMYIIANFLVKNPKKVLGYVCSTKDAQDRCRQILFSKWYNSSPLSKKFKLHKSVLSDNYCGLLYDSNHPKLDLIEEHLDAFNLEDKPEVPDQSNDDFWNDDEDSGELVYA